MSEKSIKVALIAIPNSGKTTLFNVISKKDYYVSNWPGKTVSVNIAKIKHHDYILEIFDLPGIDSLAVTTKEQILTKETIMEKVFDIYVIIVDGTSIYRSLYLAIQILEITKKVVIALNKYDILEDKGVHLNIEGLSKILGIPVIPISALKGHGIGTLLDEIIKMYERGTKSEYFINYGSLEEYISSLCNKYSLNREIVVRLLEDDPEYLRKYGSPGLIEELKTVNELVKMKYDASPQEILFIHRYNFLDKVIRENIEQKGPTESKYSEILDRILLGSPLKGILFGIIVMFFIITLTFAIATGFPLNIVFSLLKLDNLALYVEEYSLSEMISKSVDFIAEKSIEIIGIKSELVKSFILNGLASPVGILLGFVPIIFVLNVLIGIVEDSGVLPRIGVAFHSVFKRFGLSGKSLFPLLIGYGCNVPGVLTTRILDRDTERFAVIFTLPYIICQARFVVLILFVSLLGLSPILGGAVIAFVYTTSLLVVLITATIITKKIYKEKELELLISLPAYHVPSLRVVWWLSSSRTKAFIIKLFQVILPASIVIWLLSHVNFHGITYNLSESIAAKIGFYLVIPLRIIGIESWETGFALLNGLFAKELVPSTLIILSSTSENHVFGLTLPQAIGLLFFISFYAPCLPTLITMWEESKSKKLIFSSLIYSLTIAVLLSYIAYSFSRIYFG